MCYFGLVKSSSKNLFLLCKSFKMFLLWFGKNSQKVLFWLCKKFQHGVILLSKIEKGSKKCYLFFVKCPYRPGQRPVSSQCPDLIELEFRALRALKF